MKSWNTAAKRTLTAAGLALCLGLAAAAPPALALGPAGPAGADAVRSLYDTLLDTMRNGPALGVHGRYARIEPVVRRIFDIPFMTRLAVGPQWASLTEAERQQVSQAFERYIAAVYAERFDSYSGESLQVTGGQPSAGGMMIASQITRPNSEPVHIDYLLRQNGGTWQIADVYLNGTISELATRRSEFASILRTGGIKGLILVLNTKANALALPRAS